MYVFSDLDRSIIYSNKFRKKEIEHLNIEIYNGKEISYISNSTIEKINEIQKKGMFIPTTTRTLEQFNRIEFSKLSLHFDWAITTNGGVILKNGKPLDSWESKLKNNLKDSEDIDKLIEKFGKFKEIPGILKFRKAENLFFYIVVDTDTFKIDMLGEFIEKLELINWNFFVSGRKIYFLPKTLNKENAVKYLADRLEIDTFYSIGDSMMDRGMLSVADIGFVLKHGELAEETSDGFIYSTYEGMLGSEEILDIILNRDFGLEKST